MRPFLFCCCAESGMSRGASSLHDVSGTARSVPGSMPMLFPTASRFVGVDLDLALSAKP